MEIEGQNGWRKELRKGSMEFGRGLGFPTTDRTVSRRHVSFELVEGSGTRVRFQVIGKNPIWVLSSGSGDIRVFRTHEKGEMGTGDSFCVSTKNPIWFPLKRVEFPEMGRCEFESASVSGIDPVKEFGFIVMGHEFDSYPKRMIRDMKNWNWFLEEPCKDGEDGEVYEKEEKRGTRRKRKQVGEGDDEDDDWRGESDEDKEMVSKIRKNQRAKYSTRSKDYKKIPKDALSSKSPMQKATGDDNDETEDEEDDDTIGGFIVDDDDDDEEEEETDEEEEGEKEEEEDYDEDDEEMDE